MAEARLDIVIHDDGGQTQPGQAAAGMPAQPAKVPDLQPTPSPSPPQPSPKVAAAPATAPPPAAPSPAPSPRKEPFDPFKEKEKPGPFKETVEKDKPGWMEWGAGKVAGGLETAGAAARNDGMAVVGSAASAAASALGMIPGVGSALSAGLTALNTVVGAASNTVSSFVERGKQLAEWSPDLAASGARSEFVNLGADMREAQELGPSLAKLTDASTDAWDAIKEALLPIRKFIVEQLAYILSEWIVPGIRMTEETLRKIWTVIEHLPALVAQAALNAREGIPTVLESISLDFKRITRILAERDQDKAGTIDTLMDEAFRTLTARGKRPIIAGGDMAGGVP